MSVDVYMRAKYEEEITSHQFVKRQGNKTLTVEENQLMIVLKQVFKSVNFALLYAVEYTL